MPMMPSAFDTLQAAGFNDAQAEAVIATVGDAVGGNVATPADVQEVRTDIQELRQELRADIDALEMRVTHKFEALYKHLWAMSAGVVTAVAALMTLLP